MTRSFIEADAILDLCTPGEKQELCVEVVINQKRELFDFKTDLAKEFWVKDGKLELLGCFEECVALE